VEPTGAVDNRFGSNQVGYDRAALSKQDRKIVTLAQFFTDLVPLLSKTGLTFL
jgi:hypothetical protein